MGGGGVTVSDSRQNWADDKKKKINNVMKFKIDFKRNNQIYLLGQIVTTK